MSPRPEGPRVLCSSMTGTYLVLFWMFRNAPCFPYKQSALGASDRVTSVGSGLGFDWRAKGSGISVSTSGDAV